MSGLSALLALDTASLDAKIELSGGSHGASLSISITDPLDLLGDAGALIRSVGEIAEGGADLPGKVREAFAALAEISPFANLTAINEVIETLNALKARLEPLHSLMDLDPAALADQMLQGAGGLGAIVERVAGEVTDGIVADLPEAIAVPVAALRDLAGGGPASPEAVAQFFARFLLGFDLDAIARPFALLDAARAQIATGGDAAALEARIGGVTVRVDAVGDALLGRAPDLAAVLGELADLRAEVELLTSTVLPDALAELTSDLAGIDVSLLSGKLDAVLAPLVERVPVPPRGLADFFLTPLRPLADGIESFSPADVTAFLTELETDVRAAFADSDVARLRDDARQLLAGVVGFLDGLPLAGLRDQLTQALLSIEGELSKVGSFSPVGEIAAKMEEVAAAIDGIDTSAVTDRIKGLADEVQSFVHSFPIEAIRDELGALLGVATGLVGDVPPLIAALKEQVQALADQVTQIDLSAGGEASAGMIQDLRATLKEALEGADLPDALKVPLGLIADEVREIDLTASLDAPLTDLVAKIDVAGALAPVQAAIDQARAALLNLSPAAVAKRLDAPFAAVLAQLEAVSPTAVIGQLSSGFQSAAGQIDRLDPVVLIKPLQDEFDAILAKARAAADPAPLLAPLAAAYGEIQTLLDAIDPTKLLGKIVGQISKLPGALSDATAAAVAAKLDPNAVIPGRADAGPLRFGDMLRPIAALVAEARTVVRGSAEDVLADGLKLIGAPLAMLARAGETAGGHLAELGEAIAARSALVDPTSLEGPLAELGYAIDRLARIEARLSAAGRGSVALSGAVGSISLDAFVTVSFPGHEALGAASRGLTGGLNTDSIGRNLVALGKVIGDLVPPALALPDTQASILARIDALFDTIDPTPIADEMDAIGDALQAKLQSLAAEIAKGLFKIWNAIFEELEPLLPHGLLAVLTEVLDAIRAQLAVLDPARLEAELGELLDAILASLQAYSPAAFAGTLSGSFNALKAKLLELDPATLLGDLDPLSAVIDELQTLKPSVVLAPLTAQAEAVDAALADLLDFDPVAIVTAAIDNLKLQLEAVLERIEEELDGLLDDLGASDGDGGSDSVSVAIPG